MNRYFVRKALFLDRDGVINLDCGYVYRPDQIVFVDGIFDLCRRAKQKGFALIIITNQSGISRGYYSVHDFENLMTWMRNIFKSQDCELDGIYYSPHHQEHEMRKPNPGMILKAASEMGLSLNDSIFVGDKISDMEAAKRALIENRFLFVPMGVNVPEACSDICVRRLQDIQL